MGNNELHLENLVTFVFNVEVFPHVSSFCYEFGPLLASCPYKFSRVETQPILPAPLPSINPTIAPVPSYQIMYKEILVHTHVLGR
jgi:hypothetical protein